MKKQVLSFFISVLFCFLLLNPAYAIQYTITDLGKLGGTDTEAHGLNESGQVVGVSNSHPFLWENGVMIDLGSLGGSQGIAFDVNNSGTVVGISYINGTNYHGFVWDATNLMHDLGTFGGPDSKAKSVNDAGKIVGSAELSTGEARAYIWDSVNGKIPIGTLGTESSAAELTSTEKIAGTSRLVSGNSHGYYWENNVFQDVGTFDGVKSAATDVNNSGQVVGYASVGDEWHIYTWNLTDGMKDLGLLSVGWDIPGNEEIISINDDGLIVGRRLDGEGDSIAFLYNSQTETTSDLINLLLPGSGWNSLDVARDINELGQIVGQGTKDGETRAFLMTPVPVPEPGALLLCIAGAGYLFRKIARKSE